jgi:hypothetical protein
MPEDRNSRVHLHENRLTEVLPLTEKKNDISCFESSFITQQNVRSKEGRKEGVDRQVRLTLIYGAVRAP